MIAKLSSCLLLLCAWSCDTPAQRNSPAAKAAPAANQVAEPRGPVNDGNPATATPSAQWTRLYELPADAPDAWFASIAVDERTGRIFAVGRPYILQGTESAGLGLSPLPEGRWLLDVWAAANADVYAVGKAGWILRHDGQSWSTEREPVQDGRDESLLHTVRDVDGATVALGPKAVLTRQADGTWHEPSAEMRELAQRSFGGWGRVESPCASGAIGWYSARPNTSWVRCRDQKVFVFDGKAANPLASLPSACKRVWRSALWNRELFVSCSDRLWRNDGAEWREEQTPEPVREFAVTTKCLYAVGARSVMKRACSPAGK